MFENMYQEVPYWTISQQKIPSYYITRQVLRDKNFRNKQNSKGYIIECDPELAIDAEVMVEVFSSNLSSMSDL